MDFTNFVDTPVEKQLIEGVNNGTLILVIIGFVFVLYMIIKLMLLRKLLKASTEISAIHEATKKLLDLKVDKVIIENNTRSETIATDPQLPPRP